MIRTLDVGDYNLTLNLAKLIKPNFDLNDFSANSNIIVYEIDEVIVGFLEYFKNYEIIDILNIAVECKYQRQGIATKMIDYLTKIEGIEKIMLEVRESNEKAINLYKKLGFKLVRTIKNYYGSEQGYSMERSII